MKKKLIILVGFCCALVVLHGQESKTGFTGEMGKTMLKEFAATKEGRVMVLAGVASAFRESAIKDPKNAVEFHFTKEMNGKWLREINLDLPVQQQSDFFTGAILLPGPQNASGGIVGLYNPWWDAILLLRFLSAGGDDAARSAIVVDEYHFLSGETFRGEMSGEAVKTHTVVPERDPLSVELWRVCAATRKVFQGYFPVEASTTWGQCRDIISSFNNEQEMRRIQVRSVLRLQHMAGLGKNLRDAGFASVLTRLARTGNKYELYKYFRVKETRPLLQTLSELPAALRKDFVPYCYIPTKSATLFVLVNLKMPRLYVTVSLLAEPTADTSSLEWYDLAQCDDLLGAWNNRKEVVK